MELSADIKHRYVTPGINLNAFYSRCEDECPRWSSQPYQLFSNGNIYCLMGLSH